MRLPELRARRSGAERPSMATVAPSDLGLGAVARDMAEVAAEMEETKRIERDVTQAEGEARAAPLLAEVSAAFEADFAQRGAAWDGISPGFARETEARFEHFFGPFGLREDLDPATQDAVTRGVSQMRVASGQRAVQYMSQRRGALAAQQAAAREGAEVGGRMADYMVAMSEGRAALDADYDGSTPDYAARLVAVHDAAVPTILAATPEHLRPAVQQRLDAQKISLLGQGLDAEARAEGAYVAGTVKSAGASLVNSVIGAPQQWESARAEVDALVGALPAGLRGPAKAGLLDDLGTARIEGLIAAGEHDQAVELLTSGAMDADLDPDSKLRLLDRAQRAADERSTQDMIAIGEQDGAMADNLASLRMTGVPVQGAPTVEQVAAAQGPAAAAKYALDLQAAEDASKNRPAFGQMSDTQITEWVQAQAPVPGQPGFVAAQAAYVQNAQLAAAEIESRKDPAAWALRQAPALTARLEAGLAGNKAMARDFAVGSLGLQNRAGIPRGQQRILPRGIATANVERWKTMDRREGLMEAGALIDAFSAPPGASGAEVWAAGGRRRMVMNELIAANMPPADLAAAVDLTGDETAMGLYVAARNSGRGATVEKDAKTATEAAVARELRPYLASFSGVGITSALTEGRLDMTETIALDLVAQGRRPDQAARQAARIVTDDYVFVGPQGVRVPRQFAGDREAEQQVTRGMSRLTQTYLANDGALLRVPDAPEWRNLTEAQRRERWLDAVATRGRWFTTPSEAGAQLMVQGRDGRWDAVVMTDGTPVAANWQQLKVTGRETPRAYTGIYNGPQTTNATSSTPRGVRNHNPGNITVGPSRWQGQTGVDRAGDGHQFVVFDTPQNGLRALAIDLTTKHRRGLRSVRQIITTYAPPGSNDTNAYIRQVSSSLGVDPDAPLDFMTPGQLEGMMAAIIVHENGIRNPYPQSMLQEGARQARMRR